MHFLFNNFMIFSQLSEFFLPATLHISVIRVIEEKMKMEKKNERPNNNQELNIIS